MCLHKRLESLYGGPNSWPFAGTGDGVRTESHWAGPGDWVTTEGKASGGCRAWDTWDLGLARLPTHPGPPTHCQPSLPHTTGSARHPVNKNGNKETIIIVLISLFQHNRNSSTKLVLLYLVSHTLTHTFQKSFNSRRIELIFSRFKARSHNTP